MYEWGRNGLHLLVIANTNDALKYATEGGFSSKLKIECLAEIGPKARTHRPSPSPSYKVDITKYPLLQRGGKS